MTRRYKTHNLCEKCSELLLELQDDIIQKGGRGGIIFLFHLAFI